MKYLSVLALIAVPLAASAATVSILTTPEYDVRTQSLDGSKCSGYLSSKGYKTLADIPQYPNVASSTLVEGSSSSYCGSRCFSEFDFVTNAHGSPLPQVLASGLNTRARPSM